MIFHRVPVLALLASLLVLAACQDRAEVVPTATRIPGQIPVTFRNRWWHFYERGLSWAEGGLDGQAEADLRQCLALRQTDSRQARTYGMHFVQCFAHRELGAVLLRRGALDEAERELRLSLDQEPSAKAEYLLERLAGIRAGVAAAAVVVPAAPPGRRSIELASIVPAQNLLRIAGRLVGDAQTVLWSIDAKGQASRLRSEISGAFQGEVPADSALSLGDEAGPDHTAAPPLAVALPAQAAASLDLDGPDQGSVVNDGRVWYRWQAAAAAGLDRLQVRDDHDTPLADLPLRGLRAAGTLRLDLASGGQTLRFQLKDRSGGSIQAERSVVARPTPLQDRRLRAVALAIPLQAPRQGGLRPGDDPLLRSALLEDGRFRFVDAQADELLTRELELVEAGYVDRSTAAAAGARLACRYVIAGTMSRGEREAECFLRLVHCASGRVVASADAYAEVTVSSDAERLFTATAGRLHQVFPVVSTGLVRQPDGEVLLPGGRREGMVALMRVHVFAEPPASGSTPSGSIEILSVDEVEAQATVSAGLVPVRGWGVSE